jgi:hypothetical protein
LGRIDFNVKYENITYLKITKLFKYLFYIQF